MLGNCLYDKDFLARVQKIKAAPSRWDVLNLHRHPDFAPIKTEQPSVGENGNAARADSSNESSVAVHSDLGGDEFGENLFDGVALDPAQAHDDSAVDLEANDESFGTNRTKVPVLGQSRNGSAMPQPPQRIQSMPVLRPSAQGLGPANAPQIRPPSYLRPAQGPLPQQQATTSQPPQMQAPAPNSIPPSRPHQHVQPPEHQQRTARQQIQSIVST